jgi:hypothetical protein
MAKRQRTWLLYLAILLNAAVYLDYIQATVLTFVWRKTDEFGGFIRFIGWERAFDAIDLLVILWVLAATVCLFVRRATPHRFAILTNLFLVLSAVVTLARHYQYYHSIFEENPESLARLAQVFYIVALRSAFLVVGAILLNSPPVRRFYETESSSDTRFRHTAAVAFPCLLFSIAVIYVRAPW